MLRVTQWKIINNAVNFFIRNFDIKNDKFLWRAKNALFMWWTSDGVGLALQ